MKTPGTAHHYNAAGHRRGSSTSDAESRVYMPSITSEEILDENSRSQKGRFNGGYGRGTNRKVLVIGCLVFVAIAGAVVAYVVTTGDSSTTASNASGGSSSSSNSTSSASGGGSSSSKTSSPSTSSGTGTSDSDGNGKVLSDPKLGTYDLTAFAIGDWGTTIAQNDSCCQRRKGIYNEYDWHAEMAVTKLMDTEAGNKKPEVVISHGDNFYWTGIDGDGERDYRFDISFEQRHKTPAMMEVPWINVMGNHDYGGGSFICMKDTGRRECNDPADLVASLNKRFELQSSYKSPIDNRWIMKDHFYVYRIEKGDVSVDIFNLDMNDAESHGAHEICCQCYDLAQGDTTKCKNLAPTDQYCNRGNVALYNACVGQFNKWGEEARTQLMEEVKKSTATWKIVNSHYNPYNHYGETSGNKWLQSLKEIESVHLWLAGHTHGEKHDYVPDVGVHFIENGAGGGIQSESASGVPGWMSMPVDNIWRAGGLGGNGGNTYGFFAIDASAEWLKVRYMTFGDGWALVKDSKEFSDSMAGGVATGHCWYIPSDGSKGQAC